VARLARREGARRRAEIAVQAFETQQLSASALAAVDELRRGGLGRIRRLSRRIVAGDGKLDARLAKTREDLRSQLQEQFAIDRENLRRLRRRGLWDQILLATALPLFAAYGDRTNPLGTSNLTLVFLLLIWLAGDQVVEAVVGSGGSKSSYAFADADA